MNVLNYLANFSINVFKHDIDNVLNNTLQRVARCMNVENKIKFFHTPFVLPLGTSHNIGGYARSLGFSFGPKFIAINMKELKKENSAMQEFILMRQIALFDKNSRILALPLVVITVEIAFLASYILFSPITTTIITSMTAIAGAYIMNHFQEKNEEYADKKAFRQFVTISAKNDFDNAPKEANIILAAFKEKIEQDRKKSIIPESIKKFLFYSSYQKRYDTLEDLRKSMIDKELPNLKPKF